MTELVLTTAQYHCGSTATAELVARELTTVEEWEDVTTSGPEVLFPTVEGNGDARRRVAAIAAAFNTREPVSA